MKSRSAIAVVRPAALLFIIAVLAAVAYATPPSASARASAAANPVAVSFVFPGGVIKSTELNNDEVRDLLHENFGYMIEWWVRGALAKLDLPHVISVVDGSKAKAVTSVDGVANGADGKWVLYVDGIRSPYHINTQVRANERQIRLVYVPTQPHGEQPH